jgi:hypothetical protein
MSSTVPHAPCVELDVAVEDTPRHAIAPPRGVIGALPPIMVVVRVA